MADKPETVADVLAEMRKDYCVQTPDNSHVRGHSDASGYWADRIKRAMAASAVPVARVAEVHMTRCTIEWTSGPLPVGTLLYGYAPPVCWQHRPGSPCPWPASCRSNGCSAVERELYPEDAAPPAVPVESLGRDAPATAAKSDDDQDWAGMDGATAWHLIDRHANNWADIGRMMDAWLAANRKPAPPPASVPDVIESIAAGWDDCYYDDDMRRWSIGDRIRADAKRLLATTPEESP